MSARIIVTWVLVLPPASAVAARADKPKATGRKAAS